MTGITSFQDLVGLAELARLARAEMDLRALSDLGNGWRYMTPEELQMTEEFSVIGDIFSFNGQEIRVDGDGFFRNAVFGVDAFYVAINEQSKELAIVFRSLEGFSIAGLRDALAAEGGIIDDDLSDKVQEFVAVIDAVEAFVSEPKNAEFDVIATGHSLGGAIAAAVVNEVDFIIFGIGFGSPGLTSRNGTFQNITFDTDPVGTMYSSIFERYFGEPILNTNVSRDRGTEGYLVLQDKNYIAPEQISGEEAVAPINDGFRGAPHALASYAFEVSLLANSDAFKALDVSVLDEIEFARREEGNDLHMLTAQVPNFVATSNNDIITASALNVDARIEGLDGEDTISGGSGNDTLSGGGNNDLLLGGAGNDTLYGGDGSGDVAFFFNALADYEIRSGIPDDFRIRALIGNEGTDTLVGIEELQFSDVTVSVEDFFDRFQNSGGDDTPPPPPVDDHGNSRATATLVTELDATSNPGTIGTVSDEDFFSFSTQSGTIYGVTVRPIDGSLDADIRVYDAQGRFIAGDSSLIGNSLVLATFTSAGGEYSVEVSGENGTTGDYSLAIVEVTDGTGGDDNGDPTVPEVEVDTGGTLTITDEGDNGNNTFLFSSNETDDLVVVLRGGDDIARTGRGDDIIFGEDGDDEIEARNGDDIVSGGEGEDDIDGGEGRDGLSGGADDDRIEGGDDRDVIIGEGGDDRIGGGEGGDEIDGGDGDDIIDGDEDDDEISGGEGNDRLDGGTGDDEIEGGDDDDRIDGEQGDDSLDGESGEDRIRGEEGNDFIDGGEGDDELDGEEGNDRILGGSDDDLIRPGSGDDNVDGEGGEDTLSYSDMDAGAVINLLTEEAFGSDIGFDRFTSIENVDGTDGDDVIIGDEDDNVIDGEGGGDTITGGGGNDRLDGGSSTDIAVYSGKRSDYTIIASPDAAYDFQITDNRLNSPDGTDLLDSFAFIQFEDIRIRDDDALSAAPTANDDSLTVSSESLAVLDVLANDTDPDGNALTITQIIAQPSSGQVSIVGDRIVFDPDGDFVGDADETVSFVYEITDGTGWTSQATATLLVEAPERIEATATEQVPLDLKGLIALEDDGGTAGTVIATVSVDEGVLDLTAGTSGAAILSGNGTSSVEIQGTVAQINALLGASSDSALTFTANSDSPPPSVNLLIAIDNNGSVSTAATATILITSVDDVSAVTFASDQLPVVGGLLDLEGVFVPEGLERSLKGLISVDDVDLPESAELSISADFGVLNAAAGASGVNVQGNGTASITVSGSLAQLRAFLQTDPGSALIYSAPANSNALVGDLTVTFSDDSNGGAAVVARQAILSASIINGTQGVDDLDGDAGRNLVFALGDDDSVDTAGGDDLVLGSNGDDTINGGDGKDRLFGERGNDIINGGDGADFLDGEAGNDILDGGLGADTLNGGNGDDILNGFDGNDQLNPGFGFDTVNGGEGDDDINGDLGGETLNGDGGNDDISGGAGNDILNGGADNDILDGGAGIDTLNGGTGMDQLTGGSGLRDIFVLDAGLTAADADMVLDFEAVDEIDIINAGGKAFVFEQVGGDVTISADGVLVATLTGADVARVILNTEFDAQPASVSEGAPMGVAATASTQVLAEDELFTFVEMPLGDLAPMPSQAPTLMQNPASLSALFGPTGTMGLDEDEDEYRDGLNLTQDPWAPFMGMSHDHLM